MGSRIRVSPSHIFECYCEVALPKSAGEEPFVLQRFPESYDDVEVLKMVPQFTYPCTFSNPAVLHFSFVLTSLDSKWTFGFCRHEPAPATTCIVMLSSLPWHKTFYKVLNEIARLTNQADPLILSKFLEALHALPVPGQNLQLNLTYYVHAREYEFKASCPEHQKLPSIPEDRNLLEYFNAIDGNNMMIIFASMLNERRIVMTSKRLCRLTACVQAANSLIYPMFWQHIFIPVLPTNLLDYLSAPMPFLIGVPSATMSRVKKHELGDIVILDADANKIETPFDDLHMLPTEIISFLKRSLKPPNNVLGDSLARIFLKALVMLIGGYRDALSFPSGQRIIFNKEAFVQSRAPPMQPFLEKMLQLQIFQQFIEGRLQMLHEGEGFNDEFEFELNMYEDRNTHKLKTQYKEWLGGIKKEGSAMLKSVNPAVKSAYRQVRDKGKAVRDTGKKAYKNIRNRLQEKPSTGSSSSGSRPRSAPSSPNLSPSQNRRTFAFGTGVKNKNENGMTKSVSGIFGARGDVFDSSDERSQEGNSLNSTKFGTLVLPEDPYQFDPIDIDLMGDLAEVLTRRCSLVTGDTAAFSRPLAATVPPIAPPRNMTDTKKAPPEVDDLIKLESPPDDVTTIFDPLKEPIVQRSLESISGPTGLGILNDLPRTTTLPAISLSTSFPSVASTNPFASFPSPTGATLSDIPKPSSYLYGKGTHVSQPGALPINLPPIGNGNLAPKKPLNRTTWYNKGNGFDSEPRKSWQQFDS
ncbi:DENN domain-containing protein 1A [Halotydeus destructor]|nr:DENN domain-containing protein 1A [Halotydeus destructor]